MLYAARLLRKEMNDKKANDQNDGCEQSVDYRPEINPPESIPAWACLERSCLIEQNIIDATAPITDWTQIDGHRHYSFYKSSEKKEYPRKREYRRERASGYDKGTREPPCRSSDECSQGQGPDADKPSRLGSNHVGSNCKRYWLLTFRTQEVRPRTAELNGGNF